MDPAVPVAPEAPVGPAGPGTGTLTTVAGVTTVGLSQALNANAISAAENMIEYFMTISSRLLKGARTPEIVCGPVESQCESTRYPIGVLFAIAHSLCFFPARYSSWRLTFSSRKGRIEYEAMKYFVALRMMMAKNLPLHYREQA